MKRLLRRIVLSLAALSPGVASLTMQEMALSLAFALIGLTGAISVAIAVMTVSPKVSETLNKYESPDTEYPSLLTQIAFDTLKRDITDPMSVRLHLVGLMTPREGARGFVTMDDQIAMVLAQIMAQWRITEAMHLSDDQTRELWLIERLMRSKPAEAGALSENFTSPNAMLAMRDRVANSVVA